MDSIKVKAIEVKGYTLETSNYIAEIDGIVHLYTHNKTKAKVLFIQNDDAHKTFAIGFRTPPQNSTGIAHIIEHSVLCGSRKFPLKDPFVELAKGSLNTYLNAMTYPDKTLYPISSQNDADFHNLMDVYLDAVFFPNIYKNDYILMQEGWRYHIEEKEAPLEYKGVVYNEMKGAFSSPEEVSFRKIKEALFPDTIYSNESGGAPEHIPDLSYEDFLAFHKKYYHPSNSYIGLYGNMAIEETLAFIDADYLSHFDYEKIDSTIATQKPFKQEVKKQFEYSVSEEKENQIYLSYNWAVGDVTNRQLMVAMSILEYLLLDTPASPLKKALISEGVGEDVFGTFQTHLKQPIFSIIAKNVSEEKKERFYKIVDETLHKLIQTGLPESLLNGAIQIKEFELREGDFKGYSKGLLYYISCMKSWLYDKDPTIYLRYEDIMEVINQNRNNGYFEGLIETYLLNNKHAARVELYPKLNLDVEIDQAVAKKLEQIKASWTEEELAARIDKTKAFMAMQEEEETQEALHSIPILKKEDLQKTATFPRFRVEKKEHTSYIVTPVFTNKVGYINWYIDLEGIEEKYAPYLGMLVGILGKINTLHYTYEELSTYSDENIGAIEYHVQGLYHAKEAKASKRMFMIKSKALVHKTKEQIQIMKEVLTHTVIEDKQRLLEIIREMKSIMEMSLSAEGHKIAYSRLLSHFTDTELFEEETKGLTFYHFVCDIEKNWEKKQNEIIENLKKAYAFLSNKSRLTVGLTINDEWVEPTIKIIEEEIATLEVQKTDTLVRNFKSSPIKEALIYPGNVNYVAMGANFAELGFAYNGSMLMLKSILSMDYLWQNVRVKNGAYGCFADFRRSGNMFFVSYRDPNIEPTLDTYRNISQYISKLNLTERELIQYLIGTISGLDFPYTPSTEGTSAQMYYFAEVTEDMLQKSREQLFATTNETLRAFEPLIQACLEKNHYCVFGNTTSIEQHKGLFTEYTRV